MKWNRGFTAAEVIVVVAIISILASAVIFNAARGNARSRDMDRQADLKTLQAAIELYKQRYGRYPDRCANSQSWSGQLGTQFACADGSSQYIIGHVDTADYDRDGNTTERFTFAPEFIPSLPMDKRLPDANSGYVYAVNANGTVYKLAARRTVETETVTYSHPLKSCDANTSSRDLSTLIYYADAPLCNYVFSSGGKPQHCQDYDSQTFQRTYAVWGGYANGPTPTSQADIPYSSAVLTQQIVCL